MSIIAAATSLIDSIRDAIDHHTNDNEVVKWLRTVDGRAFLVAAAAAGVMYKATWTLRKIYYVCPGTVVVSRPPGLRGLLTGHLPDPREEAFASIKRYVEKYDEPRALQLRFLTETRVLILDPADFTYLFHTNAVNFKKGWTYDALLRPILGNGLVTILDEDVHRNVRRSLASAFNAKALQAMADTVYTKHIARAFDTLDDQIRQNADTTDSTTPPNSIQVEVSSFFHDVTLRIIEEAAFRPDSVGGKPGEKTLSDLSSELHRSVRLSMLLYLPFGTYLPTPSKFLTWHRRRVITDRISELVSKCRGEPPRRQADKVLFDYLLDDPTMSDSAIMDHSMTFLFAGHETTATASSRIAYLLAAHPQVQARLHEELASTVPLDAIPSLQAVKKCEYLVAVVSEAQRVYPPTVVNREARNDAQLPSGVFIPAGQTIMVSPFIVHRLKKVWGEDAEEFVPERWLEPGFRTKVGDSYMPFLHGKRNCIGKDFGYNQLLILTAVLTRRYLLSVPEGQGQPFRGIGAAMRSRNQVLVRFQRRLV